MSSITAPSGVSVKMDSSEEGGDLKIVLSPDSCRQCQDRDKQIVQLTEKLRASKDELDASRTECTTVRTELEKSKAELQNTEEQLKTTKTDLDNNEAKLLRLQSLFERGTKFAEEFLMEIVILNKELEEWKARARGQVTTAEVATQTTVDLEATGTSQNGPVESEGTPAAADEPEEGELAQEEPMSVAASILEAAQAVQQQSGFVYNKETGLYYDQNSGYYYDAEKGLYYEPYSCTYYFYNTETSSYEVHSKADLSTFSEEAQARYKQNITGEKSKKKKKKTKGPDPSDQDVEKGRKRKKPDEKLDEDGADLKHKHNKRPRERTRTKPGTKSDESESDSKPRRSKQAHNSHETEPDKEDVDKPHRSHKQHKKRSKHHRKDREQRPAARTTESRVDNEIWDNAIIPSEANSHTNHQGAINTKLLPHSEINTEHVPETELKTEIVSETLSAETCEDAAEVISVNSSDSGELPTSDSESDSSASTQDRASSPDVDTIKERSALSYPPCIRMIVTESEYLDIGNLYIIPYTGGTIGREANLNHSVVIPDERVSKMHCSIQYNDTEKYYEVKDHASQNGTFINTCRLSETHVISEPYFVSHMDLLQLGSNTFQLHIHPGNHTCDECEPGIVQSKLKAEAPPELVTLETKLSKETRRRRELKQIRKKYRLEAEPYIQSSALMGTGYEDKSASRRATKGSDNPYEKQESPASVHTAISAKNKGHKMLAKMGWKEGDSLGKSQQGITEPIMAHLRANKAAGLGSTVAFKQSLDDISKVKVAERWTKAQMRYNQLQKMQGAVSGSGQGQISGSDPGQKSGSTQKANRMQFVQGDTELFDKVSEVEASGNPDVQKQFKPTNSEPKSTKISWSKGHSKKALPSKLTVGKDVNLAFGVDSDTDENG